MLESFYHKLIEVDLPYAAQEMAWYAPKSKKPRG